ncbi:MAG TPA: LuxR C-terminal-related transcriptional regulator [Nannocystaceae bacterium]|nr:LuxR C-terminal-related transcriptional regulator [Nannocystaceae bacterium]
MHDPRLARLTARQREVLELLAKGLTNEDIGTALGIGAATVKTHVSTILKVLEVDNRTEAAGLVNLQDEALAPGFDARPAIAVLRFDVEGWPDAEGAIFAQGLVDDLIALLCQWRWFPVIARSSSLAVDPVDGASLAGVAARLRARYLVRGAVRRVGPRLRISAFLEDAEAGVCLWSERQEAPVAGLFDLQDELARTIVGAVFPALISAEVWRARRSRARTVDTWTLTHRGIWHVERRAPEDNRAAHDPLDRALASDEAFLPAIYAKGLAVFHEGLNQWSGRPIAELQHDLQRRAEAAVDLFPEAPHGHMLRARAAMGLGDMVGAIAHAEVATAINPSLASGHALLGQLLATSGRQDEGIARMQRAHRLSPRAYLSGIGIALFAAGRHDEALAALEPVLVERPRYLFARMVAIACHVGLGDHEGARDHVAALRRDHPEFRTSDLRRVYEGHINATADQLFDALQRAGIPR